MRKDREQAVVLRQSGMTYADIKSQMQIPLSTLSSWFKGQNWSNDIGIKNAIKARNAGGVRLVVLNTVRSSRLKKVYEDARQDAFVDFQELKYHPLFMAGVFLYWSHGDKTSKHKVSFASMDSRMVKMMYEFLIHVCRVSQVRFQLMLGDNLEKEPEIKLFWQETIGFSSRYFLKTVRINQKKQGNKPYYGVCNLIVNSAYLKNKILRWIELMSEEIILQKYDSIVEDAGIV